MILKNWKLSLFYFPKPKIQGKPHVSYSKLLSSHTLTTIEWDIFQNERVNKRLCTKYILKWWWREKEVSFIKSKKKEKGNYKNTITNRVKVWTEIKFNSSFWIAGEKNSARKVPREENISKEKMFYTKALC